MVFAAQKLRLQNELKAPTVIIVDDRIDLEDQITGDFTRAEIPNVENITSRNLRNLVRKIIKFREFVHNDERFDIMIFDNIGDGILVLTWRKSGT